MRATEPHSECVRTSFPIRVFMINRRLFSRTDLQRLTNSSLLVPFSLWSTLSPQKCALTIKGQNNGLITCGLLSLPYPVLRVTQDASEFFKCLPYQNLRVGEELRNLFKHLLPKLCVGCCLTSFCHRLDYSVKKSSPYVKETDQPTSQLSSMYF